MKGTGVTTMFQQKHNDQLATLYRVFSRVPETLVHVEKLMKPHIEAVGLSIVNDVDNIRNPIVFTKKLLDFKLEMDVVVEECFGNNMLF